MEIFLWITLVVLAVALASTFYIIWSFSTKLKAQDFRFRSQSTRYGQITEQFLPIIDVFPWNPKHFRFLGSPIDGIQFEEDEIILVEFKTGSSQLSKTQRRIRDLVGKRQVTFQVIRLDKDVKEPPLPL